MSTKHIVKECDSIMQSYEKYGIIQSFDHKICLFDIFLAILHPLCQ